MKLISKAFGWLVRKALLYILLVLAILAFVICQKGDVQRWWEQSQTENQRQADGLQSAITAAEKQKKDLERQLAEAGKAAQKASVAELNKQIAQVDAELRQLDNAQPGRIDRLLDTVTLDLDAVRKEQERLLRIEFLKQKRRGLVNALEAAKDYDAVRTVANRKIATAQEKLKNAQKACEAARAELRKFDKNLARYLDYVPFVDQRKAFKANVDKRCKEADRAKREYDAAKRQASARTAAANFKKRAQAWVENELPDVLEASQVRLAKERKVAENTTRAKVEWAWRHYNGEAVLRTGLAALIFITATPYLIRLFMWFVLAPLAMRRPAIRLQMPGRTGAAIAPAPPSSTSVAVRLQPGEELLVRQDYLQTSSVSGAKGDQWFLNWKKPITSLATGLVFLTRIRGDGETTTISATRDGLAEVTILSLPEGSSCVLRPRALAAVAQPIGRPLQITSHWRWASLNAWLTFQFRYLVFHGPARLVLKGGRGVRVEPADKGRVFGQDQLVGFSADLTYSVTRTETFWPYFLGRQQLLKDRVIEGDGVLIVEEAPFTARNGKVRRGLEGLVDVGMKAFGM
jgi:urease beta subunit